MRKSFSLLCERVLANGMKLSGTFSTRTSHLLLGVATMPDGRVYKGAFDEELGHPAGKGQLEEDGDMYVGLFNRQWQRHGAGEAWLADGTVYKGTFADDDLIEGTVRIPNGSSETTFVGTLLDESFVEGTLTQHDFTYTGAFQNNAPHGKGKLVYATGAEQSGTFRCGKLHGPVCRMKLEGGFVYEGEFIDGAIKRGTLYTPNYTYEGEFNEHGRAHGEGSQLMLATTPRMTFTGIWVHGQLQRGSCKDEFGTPIDYRDNHDLQRAVADEDDVTVAATHHSKAKLRETKEAIKDMNRSFREDQARVASATGKTPSKFDLGYEHSISAGRDEATAEVKRASDRDHLRAPGVSCHAEASPAAVRAAVAGSTVAVDPNKAMANMYSQVSAQHIVADRLEEQHRRFLQSMASGKGDSGKAQGSRGLHIDGNAPWKSMTP